MEKLPKRLKVLATMIPLGKTVADIGTDHAILPLNLIKSGIAVKVIASDINRGPFQKARAFVRFQEFEDYIDVRLGNGLKVLKPGEAEVVVISGLGGNTMVEILEASPEILDKAESLILNPATHPSEVRRWLQKNNWRLKDEKLVEDQGKLYQIISASRSEGIQLTQGLSEIEYEVGPIILRKSDPLLKEYLQQKLKKYEKAVYNLNLSQSRKSAEKRDRLLSSIDDIRKLLMSFPECKEEQ